MQKKEKAKKNFGGPTSIITQNNPLIHINISKY